MPTEMTPEELKELSEIIRTGVVLCQKEVLTLEEAAQYSGLKRNYLYKLTSTRVLPHSKPGGKNIFIRRADLEEWMMSSPVATEMDLNTAAMAYCMKTKTINPK